MRKKYIFSSCCYSSDLVLEGALSEYYRGDITVEIVLFDYDSGDITVGIFQ